MKRILTPDSLISLLESVEEEAYTAILVNPPLISTKPTIVLREPADIFYLTRENVKEFFDKIERLKNDGYHLLTMIDYEAGYLFSKKFDDILEVTGLKEFGVAIAYHESQTEFYDLKCVNRGSLKEKIKQINDYKFKLSRDEYTSSVEEVKEKIKLGDTYQINFTVNSTFDFAGSPASLFLTLLFNQTTKYSAFINLPTKYILSVSPELFFNVSGDTITVAPMKGTAKLPSNPADLEKKMQEFVNDPKERAENLMIVDLLRNDLHKAGVKTPLEIVSKCKAERYETVYQMITEIKAELPKKTTLYQLFEALYPCGSITGAPKISSMQIIRSLEKRNRGIYTGSIGYLHKKDMTFNVAIRTLGLYKNTSRGSAGIGSGIIWDSDPSLEYEECRLKAKFMVNPIREFQLFETMLLKDSELPNLEHHISRLKKSAELNLFYFDEKEIDKEIKRAVSGEYSVGVHRLKLLLGKYGKVDVRINKLLPLPDRIDVAVSNTRISTEDKFLYFKSTHRRIYDSGRALTKLHGLFDFIYLNERDEVCEGGITNVFIRMGKKYLTPPVSCGLLEGVGRKLFMEKNRCEESVLYLNDLLVADDIILTNSLRGTVKVDNFLTQN